MVKKVRGIAISAGVTIGFLALLALAARKTNVGDFLQQSLRGFGQNVGRGVTAPFQGILDGLTSGGQGLGESAVSLSEGFQKSVTGTLFGEEKFFFDDTASEGKASIESQASSLISSFTSPTSNLRLRTAPTTSIQSIAESSGSFEGFIEKIGQIVNPEASSPTVGLYQITFKNGTKSGVLPLSQAAIDFNRNAGNTVTRVN